MLLLPQKKSKMLKPTQNNSQNHRPITPRPSNAYSYNVYHFWQLSLWPLGTNTASLQAFWLLPLPARLAKQHWMRALIFSEASPQWNKRHRICWKSAEPNPLRPWTMFCGHGSNTPLSARKEQQRQGWKKPSKRVDRQTSSSKKNTSS